MANFLGRDNKMRLGQNPAKYISTVAQPAPVTVTVVNCIPLLSGFHAQSLDVLKACLSSLRENTDNPFDLMVFDNHSCREVREYLGNAFEQGVIQYLVLSDTNIGKIGAWNFMFGAAQGKYVAFSDSDIYFRPNWLSASLELFDAFPDVGMVTGRPLRTRMELSTATLEWGREESHGMEEGAFLDWDTYKEHEISLGHPDEDIHTQFQSSNDFRLSRGGHRAYIGAGHFQFLTLKSVLDQVMPLESDKPMRGESIIEAEVNRLKYLRLCTDKPYVMHMGNRVSENFQPSRSLQHQPPFLRKLLWSRPVRYVLLGAYSNIFRWYFENVE
jgi:glycosyltransferase involved in cell wall biosynthesis